MDFICAPPKPSARISRILLAFTLPVLLASAALGQQSPVTGVFYGRNYIQLMSMVLLDNSEPSFWEGWAAGFPAAQASITSFTTPVGETATLDSDAIGAWLKEGFATFSDLRSYYPPGTYDFHQEWLQGGQVGFPVTLASAAFPPAPQILNASNWLFAIPPGNALDLKWQVGAGTLPTDYMQLVVEDGNNTRILATPYPGQAGALMADSTGVRIPASYFTPGAALVFHLNVYRVATSNSLSGWKAFSGTTASTFCSLQVQGSAGADAQSYSVLLGRLYEQTKDLPPAPLSSNAFRGEALAVGNGLSDLHSASVRPPGLPARTLISPDGKYFALSTAYASESALLADWPQGGYLWSFDGVSGVVQGTQTVDVGTWPEPLVITSWTNLAQASPTNDLAIEWTRPAAAQASDLIQLYITDSTGHEAYGISSWLGGNTTSITISAQTLDGSTDYLGRLRYVRVLAQDTNAVPGAIGLSGWYAETQFRFKTSAQILPPSELKVTTEALPEVAAGTYCDLQLAAQGGYYPYKWSLAQGSLPPGISLNPDLGALQGLVTQSGTYNFSVRLEDAASTAFTRALSLSVTGSIPVLKLTDPSLPPVQGTVPYLAELRSSGGALPLTWSVASGALPPGLELSAVGGILSGLPQQSGSYFFDVEAHDVSGQSAKKSFQLVVPPLTNAAGLRFTRFNVAGGQVHFALNAEEADPLSIEASSDLGHWDTVFAGNYATNGVQASLPAKGAAFYRARWGVQSSAPNPISVTPRLNTNLTAEAIIGPSGGSLVLTGAQGTVFSLEIPTNALLFDVDIQMTEISGFDGLPFTGPFCGAVELQPSGTSFLKPAKLKMTLPGALPPRFTSFSAGPGGSDFYLCPSYPVASNAVVFPVMHFSSPGGSGAGAGEAETQAEDHKPCKPRSAGEQDLAFVLQTWHEMSAFSPGAFPPREDLWRVFRSWFNESVWPTLKAAEAGPEAVQDAVDEFASWGRLLEELGVWTFSDYYSLTHSGPANGSTFSPSERALLDAGQLYQKGYRQLARVFALAIVKLHVRAVEQKDPWLIWRVRYYAQAAIQLNLNEFLPGFFEEKPIFERIARVWRFDLQLRSRIELVGADGTEAEEARSGRAPIEYDPHLSDTAYLSSMLVKRYSTNIDMMSFDLSGGTIQLHPAKGKLRFVGLSLVPTFEQSKSTDCPPPLPPSKPKKVAIFCLYQISDPQASFDVWSEVASQWVPFPGQFWESMYKSLHQNETTDLIDMYNPAAGPLTCYMRDFRMWTYYGGEPFAEATYSRTVGEATENTTLTLRFAPKPIRDDDTAVPDLSNP